MSSSLFCRQPSGRRKSRRAAGAATRRPISPPMRWGQSVAPPPTPFFTPQTSPGGGGTAALHTDALTENYEVEFATMSVVTAPPNLVRVPPPGAGSGPAPISRRASTRRSGRRHQNDLHLFRVSPPPPPTAPEMLPPGGDVITYTYRFGAGGRINRQPLDPASPPPSAGAPPNS